ncbi:hypothetical protein [Escherichia coli]|uniref:hypothetical protein n=1 Tax=Escherichia coli TaxID=562 RepID=UPI0003EE8156|nr:hypothetical protein [Escherichia coli]
MHLANIFQKRSKNALYVEHKISEINIPKIKTLNIQYDRKMMMTNENAKTSLFPRRSRPVARVPHREDPQNESDHHLHTLQHLHYRSPSLCEGLL